MAKVNTDFIESVDHRFEATACLNCGVCTALCPMEIDILPRRLFRHVLLGLDEKVNESVPEIFSCLLCKLCESNCPAQVPIAENVRLLRWYVNKHVFGLSR